MIESSLVNTISWDSYGEAGRGVPFEFSQVLMIETSGTRILVSELFF